VRAINLLPRDLSRGQKKVQWIVVIPVLGAVVLSAALSIMFLSASGGVKDRQAQLDTLNAELAAIPTPDTSKVQTQGALAADKQTRVKALNTALSRRVAWDRVFRELSLILPDDVWLTNVSAKAPVPSSVATPPVAAAAGSSVAATGFTLDGFTYTQAGVARLLQRLSVIPDLVNVQLQQSTLTKSGNAMIVHFVIAADVRTPGAAGS
jgi:Tfp pilus assembly protein PilN